MVRTTTNDKCTASPTFEIVEPHVKRLQLLELCERLWDSPLNAAVRDPELTECGEMTPFVWKSAVEVIVVATATEVE